MPAIRCGFCPGATAVIAAVAHTPCARCAAEVAAHRATCPWCSGVVILETQQTRVIAFCTECEFAMEIDR